MSVFTRELFETGEVFFTFMLSQFFSVYRSKRLVSDRLRLNHLVLSRGVIVFVTVVASLLSVFSSEKSSEFITGYSAEVDRWDIKILVSNIFYIPEVNSYSKSFGSGKL